ncbi:acetyl-CoA carboxylase biotin carboxyl carrier protein [bacterium]|nr:acetyl-CoA carboxylase biotin carboxyl carrier protein [bacterium]MBU1674516.1 acetyl-CoA carboxylase biotin carboxyl carrier protein [bacterium]
MDLDKVRELVKLVEDSLIDELEISSEDTTIRIQKHATPQVLGMAASVPAMQAPMLPTPESAAESAAARNPERAKWKEIRSPIVGTFYRSPSPESPAFVNVGDAISAGQTLCIIEAMKVMNEIEAEFSGVIKEITAENASPVEAEAILFLVDPS